MKNTSDKLYDTTKVVAATTGGVLDENTKKYLEALGIANLDKQFNAAVQMYDRQLKEQSTLLQQQSDVSALASANKMADNSKLLGTGAATVQGQEFQYAKQAQDQNIQTQLIESRNDIIEQLTKSYQDTLTTVLGEQDTQGRFENIVAYQENANLALNAVLKEIAMSLNGGAEFESQTAVLEFLAERQLITPAEGGGYELTDAIYNELDYALNKDYGTAAEADYVNTVAEDMASLEYGTQWETLSDTAREKAIAKYKQWFYDNNLIMRHTTFGLSSYDEEGNILYDTVWEAPKIEDVVGDWDYQLTGDYVSLKDAKPTSFGDFLGTGKDGKQDAYVQNIIDAANNGILHNGDVVVFNYGEAAHAKEYWVYANGGFYKTAYNTDNPPPVIQLTTILDAMQDNPDAKYALETIFGQIENGMEISGMIYYDGNLYNKDYYHVEYINGVSQVVKGATEKPKEKRSALYRFQRFGDLLLTPIGGINLKALFEGKGPMDVFNIRNWWNTAKDVFGSDKEEIHEERGEFAGGGATGGGGGAR